jgi:hypothetical protein
MASPDLVVLLAYLDFEVGGPKTRSLQDTDIQKHIHGVLVKLSKSLGSRYTVYRIRQRLWNVFQAGDAYPESNFSRLFLHGSSEMVTLDQQTRELVKEQLRMIHLEKADMHDPRQLRSKLSAPITTQRRDYRAARRPSPRRNTGRSHKKIVKLHGIRNDRTSEV